jgi:ankyrin repeat protein
MSHSHDHVTADWDRNEFPDYMLASNQQESPANLALFKAALGNDLSAVHEAISAGGKVDFFHRKDDSKNALHVSAEGGYVHIVDALIKHGAHTNAVAVSGHDTPLTLCCHNGHVEVAKMLLDNGADINTGNALLVLFCHY